MKFSIADFFSKCNQSRDGRQKNMTRLMLSNLRVTHKYLKADFSKELKGFYLKFFRRNSKFIRKNE